MGEANFDTTKNFDNVFFRDLFASVSYFMYDVLAITRVVNNVSEVVKIPIFPSATGNENFIKDYYIDRDIKCPNFPAFESVANVLPSGRMLIGTGMSIDTQLVMNNGSRTVRVQSDDTSDFTSDFVKKYSRRTILTINVEVVITMKSASMIERFKILESMLTFFYKTRTLYFSSNGINKIPVTVGMSDSMRADRKNKFKFGEDSKDRYIMDTSFAIKSYLVIDNGRELLKDVQDDAGITRNIKLEI